MRVFVFWWTLLIKNSIIAFNQSAQISLLNQNNQLNIGFNQNLCLQVNGNFKNQYKLHGNKFIKSATCDESNNGQKFSMIHYDPNDQSKFGIALKQYVDGPKDGSQVSKNWKPKYYSLLGKFKQVKVSLVTNLEDFKNNEKFQWSYNQFGELVNQNLGGRYLAVNEKNKVSLLPNTVPRIWFFGMIDSGNPNLIDNNTGIDYCSENPCLNNGRCLDEINGYTCYCPAGFQGEHCEVNIDDCLLNWMMFA